MGQKINPIGMRLGINRTWDSRWYADKNYAEYLYEDYQIRQFLMQQLKSAAVSKIVIERPNKKAHITIFTARPGVIIGKKGSDIEKLKRRLSQISSSEVHINIVEVRKPDADAQILADGVARQLENRVSFRRAMKRAIQSSLRAGVKGIRINCAGRLGGAEIARMEWYREGQVPLHTLRADIDYAVSEAHTTYGVIGIKIWLYKGDAIGYGDNREEIEVKAI